MYQVLLHPGLPGGRWACMRELCGFDEAFVEGSGSPVAAELVDRLLVEVPETTVGPGTAWDLAICDRDRLLAAVYGHHFGDRIEATVPCRHCRKAFDLGFSLRDLLESLEPRQMTNMMGPDDEGAYTLQDGRRFRLPTSRDQRSVLGLDPGAAIAGLLARCVVEGDAAVDPETVQAAMAKAGPGLDANLDATCPECGTDQTARFDIQAFLLAALGQEKRWLAGEVHCLARAYGWGLREILSLPTNDRRVYVRLVQAERATRPRRHI